MQSADLSQSNTPDDTIDITRETCPMTYVRTRLKLDGMRKGQILEVRLRGADAVSNVPRTAATQGHIVVSRQSCDDGTMILRLRRG
jgi:TusA-related sulfurtransferase